MAAKAKQSAAAPHYRSTRTQKISSGGQDWDLVAGAVYDNLPQDLIDSLGGDHGGLELVPEGTLEVEQEDGTWVEVEEEEPADA